MNARTISISSVSGRWWLFVALFTSLALVAAGAPAGASGHADGLDADGEGDGTGVYEFASEGISADPPCGKFTDMKYKGKFEGTFTDNTSGYTYQGPIEAEVRAKNVGDWYENPFGIWKDSACTQPHPGVTTELVAFREPPVGPSATAGEVYCAPNTFNPGTFQRYVSPATGVADIGVHTFTGGECRVGDTDPAALLTPPSSTAPNVTITITSEFSACIRTDPNNGFFPLVPPTHCVTPDRYEVS